MSRHSEQTCIIDGLEPGERQFSLRSAASSSVAAIFIVTCAYVATTQHDSVTARTEHFTQAATGVYVCVSVGGWVWLVCWCVWEGVCVTKTQDRPGPKIACPETL